MASLRQATADAERLMTEIGKREALLRKLVADHESLQQTNKATMQSVVDLEGELRKSK